VDIFRCNRSNTFSLLSLELQRVEKLSYFRPHLVDVVIQIQKSFWRWLTIFFKFPFQDGLNLLFEKHYEGLFLSYFFPFCLFILLVYYSFEIVFKFDFIFFSVFHCLEKGIYFGEELGAIWALAENLEEILV
jgi:hypothetical protein